MNRRQTLSVLTCLLLPILPSASADRWAAPHAGTFGSDRGKHGVKTRISGDSRSATATLFTLTRDGDEEIVWSQDLGYIPARLLVSDRGWVVGVDEYGRLGYAHALTVWAPDGKQLADYKLEDLLGVDEIGAFVLKTISSRMWTSGAHFEFSHDGYIGLYDVLVIRLMWGKTIVVDLRTGRLSMSPTASAIPASMRGFTDQGVFVQYAEGQPTNRITSKWDGAGGFVCKGHFDDQTPYTLTVAPGDDGRWKSVTLESGGRTNSLIRTETLVRNGDPGSSAILTLPPRTVLYDDHCAPALFSQMIRLYDRAQGGEQSFSLLTPQMLLYNETSYDARLHYVDSRTCEIQGRPIELHRYLTIASCIWADKEGRIYLIECPYTSAAVVRQGYESLMGQSSSLFPNKATDGN